MITAVLEWEVMQTNLERMKHKMSGWTEQKKKFTVRRLLTPYCLEAANLPEASVHF
jgi:hypothetical protein